MTDPQLDARVKNKLEKQDEIEVSDEEEAERLAPSSSQTTQGANRRRSKKGSPAPVLPPSPRMHAANVPKQMSAPVGACRSSVIAEAELQSRKSSVPLAHVQITESGEFHPRNELIAPRHLGSLAFSSMSTEESSSICDADTLSRHLGIMSLQSSLQDESFSVAEKSLEDFATTADFLIHTWHKQRKDRAFLLQYEKVLEDILNAKEEQPYFSPCLNSYYRMLLHRLAEVWGFEHMICSVGNQPRISLKLTAESRVPEQLFRDMEDTDKPTEEPGRAILKRPKNNSLPETSMPTPRSRISQAKSLEERQAHYDQVRERIFNSDSASEAGDAAPKLYGIDPRFQTHDAHGAYHRSRSVMSEQSTHSSEHNFEDPQMRTLYSPYAGRPVMVQPPGMYGMPMGYPSGIMGYPSPDHTIMDSNVYQQLYPGHQPYYPGYAPSQYMPQQFVYPNLQFAQHGFPPQLYSPIQGDPQLQQMYDPSGQYMYQQYPSQNLEMPGANSGNYPPHPDHSGLPYGPYDPAAYQQLPLPHPNSDPRFGPPLIQQPHHPQSSVEFPDHPPQPSNEGLIIPLRFPVMANQSHPLNMFLKIPLNRQFSGTPGVLPPSEHGSDQSGKGFQQSSSCSGRSSVDAQNSAASPGSGICYKPEFPLIPPGRGDMGPFEGGTSEDTKEVYRS